MSKESRINHLVKALTQSGFYRIHPNFGVGKNVRKALEAFMEYTGAESRRVSRVVNALRTISPPTFAGLGRSCCRVSDSVIESTKVFIKKTPDISGNTYRRRARPTAIGRAAFYFPRPTSSSLVFVLD